MRERNITKQVKLFIDMLKNLPFRARKSKVRGFSIFKYFQIVIFSITFPNMSVVFSF